MVTSTKAPKSSASASRKRKAVALVSPNEDAENPETFLVRSRGGAKNASQLLYNNSMSDVSPSSVSSSASTKSNGRPTVSFVEMIHEALEDSDSGMLSLQEIYEAVRERYPYYRSKESVGVWLFFCGLLYALTNTKKQ